MRSCGRWARATLCTSLLAAACAKTDADWTRDLTSRDPYARGLAAIALGLQAPEKCAASAAILLETVDRSDVGLEEPAARALARIAPHCAARLVDELIENQLMTDERRAAVLAALARAGSRATQPIVQALSGPGKHLVGDLGEVLLAIGEPSVPAILVLLETAEDVRLRTFAAFLLGRLGSRARAAVPALSACLDAADPDLQASARRALQQIEAGARFSASPRADGG